MKKLKRLKRVSKADLPQRLAGALGESIKRADVKLTEQLDALNRTQLRAGDISAEQNRLLNTAIEELQAKIQASGAESADLRAELSDLRADVSQTTARLLDYISAKMNFEEECDGNAEIESLCAIIENLKEEMRRIEETVAARTQRFLTGPVGGKTDVKVFGEDENGEPVLVNNDVSCIRFRGDDVQVLPVQGSRDCVDVYVPPQGEDLANIIRVEYVNETRVVISNVPGYPLVQNYTTVSEMFIPSVYAEIVYGAFEYDALTPVAAKLISNEEAEPAYLVRYVPSESAVVVTFDSPRSGTLVVSY